MPELSFQVLDVAVAPHSAVPALVARLHITNDRPGEPVHSMLLNCQISLLPLGRNYSPQEEARLLDLFGERERWARSMKPLLWTIAVVRVSGFADATELDLHLPCTLDFDVAATKYFYGLDQGSIRASAVFSGTVFYTGANDMIQVMQIPWQSEARFELPVQIWRAAIETHYFDSLWLRLPRESFNRLYQYKVANQIPSWEQLVASLLEQADNAHARKRGPLIEVES